MSAFLGPIHTVMYNRIITLQKVINAVGELARREGWSESVGNYVITDFLPIEDVIDLDNIHASLFELVDGAEKRFAGIISKLIEDDTNRITLIEKEIEVMGREMHVPAGLSAEEACYRLQDILLDGMPCERSSEVIVIAGNKSRLVRNIDLHSDYFAERGLEGELYYHFLYAFVRGLLMKYTYNTTNLFKDDLIITV